jgi:hypothetical protein
MTKILLTLVCAVAVLTGCTGMRLVDSEVQAFSTLPPGQPLAAGSGYRFERLPSQAASGGQARLEALAEPALARVGLPRNDAAATHSVLVDARAQSYLIDAWGNRRADPWWPYGHAGHGQLAIGRGGSMVGLGLHFPPRTIYLREVSLVLRELRGGKVVYETRAVHDGPWHDTDTVLGAMFEAALRDFPHPPTGVRRVDVEIPR